MAFPDHGIRNPNFTICDQGDYIEVHRVLITRRTSFPVLTCSFSCFVKIVHQFKEENTKAERKTEVNCIANRS